MTVSDSLPEKPADDVDPSSEGDAAGAASEAHRELSWDEFIGGAAAVTDDSQGTLPPPVSGAARPSAHHHEVAHGAHESALGHESAHATHESAPGSRRAARESEQAPHSHDRTQRRAQLSAEAPREKKSRKGAWGCLIVLLVLIALMAAGAFAFQGPINALISKTQGPADFEGVGTGTVNVMIHEGETGEDIAHTLADQKVVASFDAFYSLLLKQSPSPIFQPGVYKLAKEMSARSALTALMDPANKLDQTVIIPEGTAEADVLQLVSEGLDMPLADLQAAAADVSSYGLPPEATKLEGFLFPATYTFNPGTNAHDVIKTLVNRQFEALDAAGVAPADRWRTIVLASLIQREAGLKDDYYKVSRVFLNRLDPPQWSSGLLQSDATVAYGTGNTHRVSTTDAEREDANNPYNTYIHPGLPVGPISNPGDLAIDAALHPADGTWLYFVTWNLDTGETIFSTTIEEHDAAVAKWLAWMDEHPEYG